MTAAVKLYRPSNGTEGEWFHSEFCYQCKKRGHPDGPDDPCEIWGRALAYNVTNAEFPSQWQRTDDGPVCTAFEFDDGKPRQNQYRCKQTTDMFDA